MTLKTPRPPAHPAATQADTHANPTTHMPSAASPATSSVSVLFVYFSHIRLIEYDHWEHFESIQRLLQILALVISRVGALLTDLFILSGNSLFVYLFVCFRNISAFIG
jgi:hypothetical protein